MLSNWRAALCCASEVKRQPLPMQWEVWGSHQLIHFSEGVGKVPTNFPICLQSWLGPHYCLGLAGKLADIQSVVGTG